MSRLANKPPRKRKPRPEPGLASLYSHVPFRQDTAFLAIGERTNANGSKAFREAMIAGDFDQCVEIARAQTRDGAHLLDLCVDYVGRDGAADMAEVAGRLATAATLPLMLDSTEPEVVQAGLEWLGGRAVVNSVNYEDGDGPDSRIAKIMPLVREHGAAVVALTIDEQGQARTAEWKVAIASRLIEDLTGNWGMRVSDIIVDCLTFPITTGQEETRRDAIETIEAIREVKRRYPDVQTTLGVSNVSFGLNPAGPGRAELGVPARVRARPGWTRRSCTPPGSCRSRGSPTSSARSRSTWSTTGAGTATTRWRGCSSCSKASTPPRSRRAGRRSWPACRSASG